MGGDPPVPGLFPWKYDGKMERILFEESDLPGAFPQYDRIALVVKTWERDGDCPLHPVEQELLSPRAVEKRRREFSLGRAAAHGAIASLLGRSQDPILKGERGEPLWPQGLVGAITHCGDVAVAAVGRTRDTDGIGVDLEQLSKKVSLGISRKVCTPREREWVSAGGDETEKNLRLRMIFSAKESTFKAFFPVEEVYLGFQDAELIWDPRASRFTGKMLRRAGRAYPSGYPFGVEYRRTRGSVFTLVCLPPCG